MSGDVILLEPRKAAETLIQMRQDMKSYIDQIMQIAQVLQAASAFTFANPMALSFVALAKTLTQVGHMVNTAVDVYSKSFAETVNRLRDIDAPLASRVSFDKPGFDGVFIKTNDANRIQLSPGKVRDLMNRQMEHGKKMGNHFDAMNNEITSSASYWVSGLADKTRHQWSTKILPHKGQADQLLHRTHDQVGNELTQFLSRHNG